jgi:predicted RNase H-like HicB family nuclease
MKKTDFTMNEIIFLIEEDEVDGGYNARALGEAIFTFGKTKEELLYNIREAVDTHFDEGKAPKVIRLHYVREEVYAA